MLTAWIDYVYDDLDIAGLKHGAARDRIIMAMADQPCAISAVELEDLLRKRGERTARATIYRVLDLLVERGLVERVVVNQGQARFERVELDGHHHHHLVCDRCGELVAFSDPGLERAISRLSDRIGVRVESHEVTLRGACGRCE
jgi:Fur family ferric uptake transcriptional regulator